MTGHAFSILHLLFIYIRRCQSLRKCVVVLQVDLLICFLKFAEKRVSELSLLKWPDAMRFLTYARKKVRAVSAIVLLSAFGCFIWSVSYFSTSPYSSLSLSKELAIDHHDQPFAGVKSPVAIVKVSFPRL